MPLRRLSTPIFALSTLLAAHAPALAEEATPETGVLNALENGDVSCYLALTPPGGEEIYVSADFALCERQDLIGSKVSLRYEEARVLAASCEGDMDCGKTDIIQLAVEMTKAE